MNDIGALIWDIIEKIDDDPTTYNGVIGTLDYHVDANGIGFVDVRTLDDNVVTVVVMALHPDMGMG